MVYTIEPQINDKKLGQRVNEEVESFANVKCIKNSNNFPYCFVCFNYALGTADIHSCEDGLEELEFNYIRIAIEDIKEGDVVTYHEDFGEDNKSISIHNIMHFAIVTKTNRTIKGTEVKSKWGSDGVFLGALDEMPDRYGEIIAIWRKRK